MFVVQTPDGAEGGNRPGSVRAGSDRRRVRRHLPGDQGLRAGKLQFPGHQPPDRSDQALPRDSDGTQLQPFQKGNPSHPPMPTRKKECNNKGIKLFSNDCARDTKVSEREMNMEKEKTIENTETHNDSIAKYLKDHASVLIAIISATVAITTFCINASIYLINLKNLRFWGFSKEQTSNISTNQIYTITIAIFCIVFYAVSHLTLQKTFNLYVEKKKNIVIIRKALNYFAKQEKRERRHRKKQSRKIERQLKSRRGKNVTDHIVVESQNPFNSEEAEKKYKKLLPLMKEVRLGLILELIPTFLLSYMLSWPILLMFAFLAKSSIELRRDVPLSLAFPFLMLLSEYISAHIGKRTVNKKEINELTKDTKKLTTLLEQTLESSTPDYPVNRIMKASWIRLPTNRELSLFVIIYIILMMMISFIPMIIASKPVNNEIPIIQGESSSYAIVYQLGNVYYMEEANISGTTIEINTNKQKILETKDVDYEVTEFETVRIIKNGKIIYP